DKAATERYVVELLAQFVETRAEEEDEGEDEDDEEKAEGNGRTTGAQDGRSRSRPCRRRTAARCGTADGHRGTRCQLPPDPLPATAGPAAGLPRDAALGAAVGPTCPPR